jgi:hypothetical protein
MHEIVAWNSYDHVEKTIVMRRLSTLLEQVLEEKIRVVNPDLLRRQLALRQIEAVHPGGDAECVQALLRSAAGQMQDPSAFGVEIYPEFSHMSPLRLRDQVDSELHTLAIAHYERYVKA